MKNLALVFFAAGITACSNNNNNTSSTADKALEVASELTTNIADTLCFLHTDGLHHEDTTIIKLVIHNNDVSGMVKYIPYEKDQRTGILRGEKKKDIINCIWVYSQEGTTDSTAVAFKLSGNKLTGKHNDIDSKTGREILTDTAAYNIEYDKTDCL